MHKDKIMTVFGTRPEAIKMAPVIKSLEGREEEVESIVCVTGQHREMLDQMLRLFSIEPDLDLAVMEESQSLAGLSVKLLRGLDRVMEEECPDFVLVQGDTTTAFIGALSAFYRQISVGHVEAGLRSGDRSDPFPEEINRILSDSLADLHFPPTEKARGNLISEGLSPDNVFVTGNTVIDSLLEIEEAIEEGKVRVELPFDLARAREGLGLISITAHRRENLGEGIRDICRGVKRLALSYPDLTIVFPLHLNPKVRGPVGERLGDVENVLLIEPLEYLSFVALMKESRFILTDSGGVQEEAPSLGLPVLVMRETTERPEGLEAGTARLVGTDADRIVEESVRLLEEEGTYEKMVQAGNPYGDGKAGERIAERTIAYLRENLP